MCDCRNSSSHLHTARHHSLALLMDLAEQDASPTQQGHQQARQPQTSMRCLGQIHTKANRARLHNHYHDKPRG